MSQVLAQDLQRQMERLADEKMRLKKMLSTSQLSPAERQQTESQIASYTKAMLHLTNQRVQMLAVESMCRDEESRFCSKVICWQQRPCLLHDVPFLGKILASQAEYVLPTVPRKAPNPEREVDARPPLTRVLSKPIEAEFTVADVAPLPLNTVFELNAPLSRTARSIGARWLNNSGAKELMDYESECGVSYDDYVRDKSALSSFDQEQIDKDMARTRPRGLTVLSYRAWCAQMHELSTCSALRRLVTCFTKRFHQIGYPQGIDHLAMFLLGFMTEEEAFWTLCAIAEKIRDRDYYSPPPSSLTGFLVQRRLFVSRAEHYFPHLLTSCPEGEFTNALVAVSARWFLIAFVGLVEFWSSVLIFDAFLAEGDYALMRVGCALIELAEKEIVESQEPLATLLSATASITPQQVQAGLDNPRFRMSASKRLKKITRYRQETAQQWSSMKGSKLDALAVYAGFTNAQIATMQTLFAEVSKSNRGGGLRLDQFKRMIEQTCPGVDFMAPEFLDHLFKLCDQDGNGVIDFREMICCLSLLWKGNLENKLRMCFDCYDTNRDGFLSAEDILVMSAWLQQLQGPDPEAKADEEIQPYAEKMGSMDVDGDGKVTFAEFKAFIESDPRMVQAFIKVQDPSITCNKETIHTIRGDRHWFGRLDVSFRGIFRGVKNLQYSDIEVRVREATSNVAQPAPCTLMQDIAEASFDKRACSELMGMLWKRLKDDSHYLHIQKSLQLLEYLLRNGSDRLVTAVRDRKKDIQRIQEYHSFDVDGQDLAQLCRDKAAHLIHLLENPTHLAELRLESRRTRAKIDGSLASLGSSTSSLRQGSQSRLHDARESSDAPRGSQHDLGAVDAFADFPMLTLEASSASELVLEANPEPVEANPEPEPVEANPSELVLEANPEPVEANPEPVEPEPPCPVVVHFKEEEVCAQPDNPFVLCSEHPDSPSTSEASPSTNPFDAPDAFQNRPKWVEPQTNPFDMSQNPLEDDPFAS